MASHALSILLSENVDLDSEIYTTYSDIQVYDDSGQVTLRHGIALATDVNSTAVVSTHQMYLDNDVCMLTFIYIVKIMQSWIFSGGLAL